MQRPVGACAARHQSARIVICGAAGASKFDHQGSQRGQEADDDLKSRTLGTHACGAWYREGPRQLHAKVTISAPASVELWPRLMTPRPRSINCSRLSIISASPSSVT